jgi:hypothetical protein
MNTSELVFFFIFKIFHLGPPERRTATDLSRDTLPAKRNTFLAVDRQTLFEKVGKFCGTHNLRITTAVYRSRILFTSAFRNNPYLTLWTWQQITCVQIDQYNNSLFKDF